MCLEKCPKQRTGIRLKTNVPRKYLFWASRSETDNHLMCTECAHGMITRTTAVLVDRSPTTCVYMHHSECEDSVYENEMELLRVILKGSTTMDAKKFHIATHVHLEGQKKG